jgi:hypothetical protein
MRSSDISALLGMVGNPEITRERQHTAAPDCD